MASSSTVGTAVIKLSFDGSDVKAELSRTSSQFKEAGEKAGSAFGSAITVAMGSLISKGVSKVISSITSNLDSAINRVDVVNNFPKVMQSLGFSTDEAALSIKTISDRLDGLPSTLNGVVGDVQKLTATMGNLNNGMVNATSLGLALNDMFLAGGKGTEAASNAMEQYNQMLAQGKPDMQSWRSILNAAPGQLKQLAKTLLGATASQNDLYEALQKGNVTFDQMNEAIVRLDREGGDGFDSFERQARSATGGVGTALENVQNRISKAIAKVIDVIGADNIANAINGISSHFGEVGEAVGQFVKFAMVQIGEFSRFISQNMWIVDTLKGALASIVAIGIGKKIIDLKNKIQTLFAAISAHPLAALATVLIGVATAIMSATSRETELTKAIKDTHKACEDSISSWGELTQRRQEAINKGIGELTYYESLQEELKGLVDENGKVKAGYEDRVNFIIGKLKDALGIEIQMQDGVIQNHKELQGEISKTIEYKKAELKLKAFEEQYTKAINDRAAASKRLAETEANARKAMEEGRVFEAIQMAKDYEEQERLIANYSATIKGYESDLAAFTEGRYDDMSNAAWDWIDDLVKAQNAEKSSLERGIKENDVLLRTSKSLYQKYGDDVYRIQAQKYQERDTLLRSKLNSYNNTTASSLNQNKNLWNNALNSNTNAVWSKGGEMVNAGAHLVNSLANGENNASWNALSVIQNTANSISSIAGAQYGAMYANGQNLMYGLGNGLASQGYAVVSNVFNQFMSDFKFMFGIHSPSTVFRDQIGVMLAKGLGIGFEDEMKSVTGDMAGAVPSALVGPSINYAYANNWSGMVENAIMEQSGNASPANSTINVYMNNTIDNDMSIDELGRKFSQSIRRYA